MRRLLRPPPPVAPDVLRRALAAGAEAATAWLALAGSEMPPVLVLSYPPTGSHPGSHAECYALPRLRFGPEAGEDLETMLAETVPELIATTGALSAVLGLLVLACDDAMLPDGLYPACRSLRRPPQVEEAPAQADGEPGGAPDGEAGGNAGAPEGGPPEQLLLLGADGTTVGAGRAEVSAGARGERHAGPFAYLYGGALVGELVPRSLSTALVWGRRNRGHN
jgi:hypothetical protein